ncbi:Serine/threonine-protein kinase PknD [compost metagenome]
MRKYTLSLTLAVGLALVGCSTLAPLTPTPGTVSPQTQPAFEPGDLVLRLQVGDSRTLQAGGSPVVVYDVSDVAKLVITPYLKVGDAFVPMSTTGKPTTEEAGDRLKIDTTDRHQRYFVFKNLPADQTYRFRAQAYDAQNTLISKDADSFSDVTFTRFTYANTPTLQLKLKDKPFVGTAKATVRFALDMGDTHHVVVELYKKGTPDVKVGTAVEIAAADFGSGRMLTLGGLAPKTTYLLKAEARAQNETVLTSGSVEWVVDDDQELADQTLTLSFEPQVSTYAGSTSGDQDGTLATARFGQLASMARAQNGDLYVADSAYHRIRRIDTAGNVTTFAGSGAMANVAGNGTAASIMNPMGLAIDSLGNLFVASHGGNAILKITPNQEVSIFAGSGMPGSAEGQGAAASFNRPNGLCVDSQDNLYVADAENHRIRKITPGGIVSTWAGSTLGFNDGNGTSAQFNYPLGLAIDAAQNLYVADSSGLRIRTISPTRDVATLAGTGLSGFQDGPASSATFLAPFALSVGPDGSVYVSDLLRVRRIKGGQVTTVAGGMMPGSVDGPGAQAQFFLAYGSLFLPDGSLLVADTSRIRRIVNPQSAAN